MIAAHVHTLLDPEAMRGAFAAIPVLDTGAARLCSLALERLWVKPFRHFHASYRLELETEGGPIETLACASLLRPDQAGAVLQRAAVSGPTALPGGPARWSAGRSTALVTSPPMLVQLFPWDYRLPTLPLALDARRLGEELKSLTLEHPEPVAYCPGMRCQIRYRKQDGGVLYGKVFPDGAGADVGRSLKSIAEAVRRTDGLTVPRAHAWVASLNLLLTESVEGTPLIDSLGDGGAGARVSRVAGALARFHALPATGLARLFGPADDLGVVGPWVDLVSTVFPDLAPALAVALAGLEQRLPSMDQRPPVLVHRDFYDRQILIAPSAIALLDLDTACRGHAEIDVANFTAHLVLRGLQWHDRPDAFADLVDDFVDTYRRERADTDLGLVAWYRSAALLRLACVYSLRPWWRALAPRLIEESRRGLA